MELDEMKQAWQALDHRLARQHALNVQLLRDGRLERMRRSLRPLVWGQALQIALGAAGLLALAPIWIAHRDNAAVLVAGVVVHLYCIGLIVVGAMVEAGITRIDYGAPVLAIQRQWSALRRAYAIRGAIVVGLPWWFLSAPLMVVLSRGMVMELAPAWVWGQLAVGAAGLLATVGFYRWIHRPGRAGLARRLDAGITGGSLRRAQAMLEEIACFERE
jgi:hypothetical protein